MRDEDRGFRIMGFRNEDHVLRIRSQESGFPIDDIPSPFPISHHQSPISHDNHINQNIISETVYLQYIYIYIQRLASTFINRYLGV